MPLFFVIGIIFTLIGAIVGGCVVRYRSDAAFPFFMIWTVISLFYFGLVGGRLWLNTSEDMVLPSEIAMHKFKSHTVIEYDNKLFYSSSTCWQNSEMKEFVNLIKKDQYGNVLQEKVFPKDCSYVK